MPKATREKQAAGRLHDVPADIIAAASRIASRRGASVNKVICAYRDAASGRRCGLNASSLYIDGGKRADGGKAMDRHIMAMAAARYCGVSLSDFIAQWIDTGIGAAMEDCRRERGKWLPLTKHEAATLKSNVSEWAAFAGGVK